MPGKLAAQLPLFRSGDPMLAVACGWQDVPVPEDNRPSDSGPQDSEPQDTGPQDSRAGTGLIHRRSLTRLPRAAADPALFASGCWFCPGATSIVTREAFRRVGPLDSRLRRLEDLDWFLRFALQGGRLEVAPVCGALVAWTPRGNALNVDAAARLVKDKFSAIPEMSPMLRRRLNAWLAVERAKAQWTTSGKPAWTIIKQAWATRRPTQAALRSIGTALKAGSTTLAMMATSHRHHQRPHPIQMENWWTTTPPKMPYQNALDRLGLTKGSAVPHVPQD